MNTDSVDCRRFLGETFPEGLRQPGDFMWDEPRVGDVRRCIYIVLPGDKNPSAIECIHGPAGPLPRDRIWGWDGNEDKPTLTPSIHEPECWHGHLIAGRLVSC